MRAGFSAIAHRLAEGRALRRRVVERGHDLDVHVVLQGQDEVLGSEVGMASAVSEGRSQLATESLHGIGKGFMLHCIRHVI